MEEALRIEIESAVPGMNGVLLLVGIEIPWLVHWLCEVDRSLPIAWMDETSLVVSFSLPRLSVVALAVSVELLPKVLDGT